jgi:trehalose 6-phosphate synthase/phosphatase
LRRSSGGLATGLRGVHERANSLWIGWTGLPDGQAPEVRSTLGMKMRDAGAIAVSLDEDEIDGFYRRYANGVLWPLLHDLPMRSEFGHWTTYRRVNERYADTAARHARPGDRLWVHDYQLMLVPQLLRERRPDVRIGFFLHSPFPKPETFTSLPHAAALLEGLLGADIVGFHTREYARHFLAAVRTLLPYSVSADQITVGERQVSALAWPMGIDVASFEAYAEAPAVVSEAKRIRGDGFLFLGVDRLDYTKGIPQRLVAFERLLDTRPELHGQVRLLQLAVPSREDVEGLVARINARFSRPDWTPVEYQHRSVDVETLVTLYRAADVMLVTSLRDGMNLVAKEFVAARVDCDGILILSEHAGAASELRTALLVDPHDVDALAGTYEAALAMSPTERWVRMRRLRRAVRMNDVHRWAAFFIEALRAPRD